jgi:hypothetical protein
MHSEAVLFAPNTWRSNTTNMCEVEYDKVMDSLIKFMHEHGIELYVRDEYGNDYYEAAYINYEEPAIEISQIIESKNKVHGLALIAHELGHWLDCMLNYGGDAYKVYNAPPIRREEAGWLLGAMLLKRMGFTHWEGYNLVATALINSYYNILLSPDAKKRAKKEITTALNSIAAPRK